MKIFEPRIILTIIAFLLMILSGILLSRKGKPYNVILFNIHKLISLIAILVMVFTVIYYLKGSMVDNQELMTIIGIGSLFLVLLVTGGLLNLKKEMPVILLYVHRLFPILLVILSSYFVYSLIY